MTTTSTGFFVNGTFGDIKVCSEIVAPAAAGNNRTTSTSYCVQFPPDFESCEVQIDGQVCTSCTVSPMFGVDTMNCSNVVGEDWDPNAEILDNLPIIQACYQPRNNSTAAAEPCILCSGGGYINATDTRTISLEGFGNAFPCYDLELANWFFQISAEKCPEAAAVAQAECCSLPPSMAPGNEEEGSSTAAPISSTAEPDPPTAVPSSSVASSFMPLCSAAMMLLTEVLLLFAIME